MSLRIYNSLTKKKETFEPVKEGEVKMYVCGPTVYDFLHVGNFRGAVFFNLVRNWLQHIGNRVTYVYNYTDVDDKIIKKANDQGKSSTEIAEYYIKEFEKDYNSLGLRPHDHNPRATQFIEPIVEIIEKLIANGKAYVVDGEVFYAVRSFEGYGRLSQKDIEDLKSGARVEIGEKKQDPLDFSLWKPSKEGEPSWPSPWGPGRPGWHIECSAMSLKILGESIDIHGGGVDLIFPHHENEIAQSEGATGKPFVKYWMHNNFINMGSEKMSKSLGNVTTARAFFEKYHPEIYKYMILSAHYRTQSDFSKVQVQNAISGLGRIYSSLALAADVVSSEVEEGKVSPKFAEALKVLKDKAKEALNDDFNTPEVFARIFEAIRSFNSLYRRGQKVTPEIKANAKALRSWLDELGRLMAIFVQEPKAFLIFLDDMLLKEKSLKREEIDQLVRGRGVARQEKDFAKADEIRDKLAELGIDVQDTPQGTVWEVHK
jgi:cysteinyl-tRNA synthetase